MNAAAIKTTAPIFARNVFAQGDRVRAVSYTDGSVLVWDSVAKHYTTCHNLTPAQVASVRTRAARLAV